MAGGTGSKGETEAMVDDVANNLKNITTLIPDLQRTLDQQKRANAELEREKRDAAKAAADQLSAHARAFRKLLLGRERGHLVHHRLRLEAHVRARRFGRGELGDAAADESGSCLAARPHLVLGRRAKRQGVVESRLVLLEPLLCFLEAETLRPSIERVGGEGGEGARRAAVVCLRALRLPARHALEAVRQGV